MRGAGFTLLEMMVGLAILVILLLAVEHLSAIMATRDREQQLYSAVRALRGAIDSYKRAYDEGHIAQEPDASGYPKTLQVLVDGVEDQQDPQHRKMHFLDRLPRDPMLRNDAVPAADTWALRAYASDPASPAPGVDIYDVHSKSTGIGLNGAPYSQW
ncbi:MAG: ral secretion pathway protein gspG [Betaproteobacteria bacterium]|nr:ral secretion pathway protein gspG [Betaproteobacteria bacterium]